MDYFELAGRLDLLCVLRNVNLALYLRAVKIEVIVVFGWIFEYEGTMLALLSFNIFTKTSILRNCQAAGCLGQV